LRSKRVALRKVRNKQTRLLSDNGFVLTQGRKENWITGRWENKGNGPDANIGSSAPNGRGEGGHACNHNLELNRMTRHGKKTVSHSTASYL